MIDEGFIRRTYRTSLVVWGTGVLIFLIRQWWYAAIGFTVGSAVSLGILASLERVIRRTVVPGATGVDKTLAKVGIVKLLIIVVVIIGVVITRRFDLILAFCAGVGLTQVVMFLKVIGLLLIERMRK